MPFIVADDIIIVITVGAPKKVNSCCCARTRLCWRVNKQFELVAAARLNMWALIELSGDFDAGVSKRLAQHSPNLSLDREYERKLENILLADLGHVEFQILCLGSNLNLI